MHNKSIPWGALKKGMQSLTLDLWPPLSAVKICNGKIHQTSVLKQKKQIHRSNGFHLSISSNGKQRQSDLGTEAGAVEEPALQDYSLIRSTESQNVMMGHYTPQIALTSVNRDELEQQEEEGLKYKRTRKGHSLVN